MASQDCVCVQAASVHPSKLSVIAIIIIRCRCVFICNPVLCFLLISKFQFANSAGCFPNITSSTRCINRGSMVRPSLISSRCRRVFISFICITLLSRRIACRLSFNYSFATPPLDTIRHPQHSICLILKQIEIASKAWFFAAKVLPLQGKSP